MIDSNFKYFNDNFEELCKSYLGKYIVIKDESVIGRYNSFDEAFNETIKTEEIGSFLIQLCSSDEDNNINYFYSNNAVFVWVSQQLKPMVFALVSKGQGISQYCLIQ